MLSSAASAGMCWMLSSMCDVHLRTILWQEWLHSFLDDATTSQHVDKRCFSIACLHQLGAFTGTVGAFPRIVGKQTSLITCSVLLNSSAHLCTHCEVAGSKKCTNGTLGAHLCFLEKTDAVTLASLFQLHKQDSISITRNESSLQRMISTHDLSTE
jgi:hypothetical protein